MKTLVEHAQLSPCYESAAEYDLIGRLGNPYPQKTFTGRKATSGMEIEPCKQNTYFISVLVILLFTATGCVGFFGNSGPNAGELLLSNDDNDSHSVVIQTSGNGELSLTVDANSSQTVTLFDSPGDYSVNATIDGTTRVNTTVDYSPGGEDGEQLAGPGLRLTIDPEVDPYFSQSYD